MLSQSKTMTTKQQINFMIDILKFLEKLLDLRILETPQNMEYQEIKKLLETEKGERNKEKWGAGDVAQSEDCVLFL